MVKGLARIRKKTTPMRAFVLPKPEKTRKQETANEMMKNSEKEFAYHMSLRS